MMNLSVLVGKDRELITLLRACGARVTEVSTNDLAALAHPSASQPDVIVVDRRGQSGMPAELGAIKRQHPSTGVLAVMETLDAALVLEAMRVGVNECVAEPVTRDGLSTALQLVSNRRPAARRGDVFAVIGAKGGVGATTVAVNVATILNKVRPSGSLLMDLHVTYGDAGLFLGAEPRFSTLDALQNLHRMDAMFLRTLLTQTSSGLHLLASSEKPASAPVDATNVRTLIELAATEFPYVVLDVPRSDTSVLDALEPASSIVVVANQELATVRSAGRMASALEQRYGKNRVNVIVTRYDPGAEISQKDVERVVGRPVSYVFPNNYAIALSSQHKGRPLVLDNHSKLASAFTSFANQLAGVSPVHPSHDKQSGLLALISGGRR